MRWTWHAARYEQKIVSYSETVNKTQAKTEE
jgi:hypothetical protein